MGCEPFRLITGFALDNREAGLGDLFLAIKGERQDGHDFALDAIERGATAAMVERPIEGPHVLVDDLVEALARFAGSCRADFESPVVAVTGSNGKTTTKEMTAAALTPLGPVLKSPANRNTEYTSPLVWADAAGQKSAVIEMAMRGPGQIAHLAKFTRPDVGVVTVIGTAHVEKVGTREGIMLAKAELLEALPADGVAVVWREDDFWPDLCERSAAPVRSFGFSVEAECRILGYRAVSWDSCVVRLSLDGKVADAHVPAVGRHQAQNAAAAVLAAHSVGVPVDQAAEALARTELPPLRLQVREKDGVTVILDTYNASPDSTVAAIQTIDEVPCEGRRVAVLGEMKELGDFTESGHRMVGKALANSSIDYVFLTGGPTGYIADEATMAGYPADQVEQDEALDIGHVRRFLGSLRPGDVALVKGSRALGLERALEDGADGA